MPLFFHGTHKKDWKPNLLMCLTDDVRSARTYGPLVYLIKLDMAGLKVADMGKWDRDNVSAPGDPGGPSAASLAKKGDVITFMDEDYNNRQHRTWRPTTQKALKRIEVVDLAPDDE